MDNAYITGHRLGYPHTKSWLAFWYLDKLEKGDDIYITDSKVRKYTYVVYEKSVGKGFSCGPMTSNTLSYLEPVEGKNTVTLKTCALPDYTKRLLVRGELKGISGDRRYATPLNKRSAQPVPSMVQLLCNLL